MSHNGALVCARLVILVHEWDKLIADELKEVGGIFHHIHHSSLQRIFRIANPNHNDLRKLLNQILNSDEVVDGTKKVVRVKKINYGVSSIGTGRFIIFRQ